MSEHPGLILSKKDEVALLIPHAVSAIFTERPVTPVQAPGGDPWGDLNAEVVHDRIHFVDLKIKAGTAKKVTRRFSDRPKAVEPSTKALRNGSFGGHQNLSFKPGRLSPETFPDTSFIPIFEGKRKQTSLMPVPPKSPQRIPSKTPPGRISPELEVDDSLDYLVLDVLNSLRRENGTMLITIPEEDTHPHFSDSESDIELPLAPLENIPVCAPSPPPYENGGEKTSGSTQPGSPKEKSPGRNHSKTPEPLLPPGLSDFEGMGAEKKSGAPGSEKNTGLPPGLGSPPGLGTPKEKKKQGSSKKRRNTLRAKKGRKGGRRKSTMAKRLHQTLAKREQFISQRPGNENDGRGSLPRRPARRPASSREAQRRPSRTKTKPALDQARRSPTKDTLEQMNVGDLPPGLGSMTSESKKAPVNTTALSTSIQPAVAARKKLTPEEEARMVRARARDKEWHQCLDRRGIRYYLNMSSRDKCWWTPSQREDRRIIKHRPRPPGLTYFDSQCGAEGSDYDSESDDENDGLECLPKILEVTFHTLLPPKPDEFKNLFGISLLTEDEVDAVMPSVQVKEFTKGEIIMTGSACEETIVICRKGCVKIVWQKGRHFGGRGQQAKKSMQLHAGDSFGSVHVRKANVDRLESLEPSEILVLEHIAITSSIKKWIRLRWEHHQKNERKRRLQIKLRKQAILQNKMAEKRGVSTSQASRRHSRRVSHHTQRSSASNLENNLTAEDTQSYINSLLKGEQSGKSEETSSKKRHMSIRGSISLTGNRKLSLRTGGNRQMGNIRRSILANKKKQRESIILDGSPVARKKSIFHKSSRAQRSSTHKDSKGDEFTSDVLDKEDMFDNAMEANTRAEEQSITTITYLTALAERMLMYEEDNLAYRLEHKERGNAEVERKQQEKKNHEDRQSKRKRVMLARKAKEMGRALEKKIRKERAKKEKERRKKEKMDKEALERRANELEQELVERTDMWNAEHAQLALGDRFWGIDLEMERQQEELRQLLVKQQASWQKLGKQRRQDQRKRSQLDAISHRHKYMKHFWRGKTISREMETGHLAALLGPDHLLDSGGMDCMYPEDVPPDGGSPHGLHEPMDRHSPGLSPELIEQPMMQPATASQIVRPAHPRARPRTEPCPSRPTTFVGQKRRIYIFQDGRSKVLQHSTSKPCWITPNGRRLHHCNSTPLLLPPIT